VTRWERATEWPLMGAAVLFLAAWAWPILDLTLSSATVAVLNVVVWVTWALFALDYVVRLAQAADRWDFVKHNLLDLAVIILPLLRPLRLLRLVTLLTFVNRRASSGLRGKVAVYMFGGSSLLGFVAALAVLKAERPHPDATITTFGDALWWAITTMTTVGYGDTYPVTTTGRFVAAGLMVGGIALLGTVTGTLASWLTEKVAEAAAPDDDQVAALRAEVARLTEELERQRR
jgi:voltage-gated potassium channel